MQHREVYVSSSDSRESEELGAPNRYHMHYSDGEGGELFNCTLIADFVHSFCAAVVLNHCRWQ